MGFCPYSHCESSEISKWCHIFLKYHKYIGHLSSFGDSGIYLKSLCRVTFCQRLSSHQFKNGWLTDPLLQILCRSRASWVLCEFPQTYLSANSSFKTLVLLLCCRLGTISPTLTRWSSSTDIDLEFPIVPWVLRRGWTKKTSKTLTMPFVCLNVGKRMYPHEIQGTALLQCNQLESWTFLLKVLQSPHG